MEVNYQEEAVEIKKQLFRHDLFVNGEFVGVANDWDELEKVWKSLQPRSGHWKEIYSCSGGGYGYSIYVDCTTQKTKFIHHKMNSLLTDCEGATIYMGDTVVMNNGIEGEIDTRYDDEEHLFFIHDRCYEQLEPEETGSSFRVKERIEEGWR